MTSHRVDSASRASQEVGFGLDFDFDLQGCYGEFVIYVNGSLMVLGVGVWSSASGECLRGSVLRFR